MQDLHIADRPGLSLHRVARRMLPSTRMSHIIRTARMLLNMAQDMVLHMALGMALDIATGVEIVRDIGLSREAYPYPAAYPNSNMEL